MGREVSALVGLSDVPYQGAVSWSHLIPRGNVVQL